MLPRAKRLHTRRQFQAVAKRGLLIRGQLSVLRAVPNKENKSRFGMVVSKAVCPKANQRNLIKRRWRAILRDVNTRVPYDVAIYANKKINSATFAEMSKDIKQQVKNL